MAAGRKGGAGRPMGRPAADAGGPAADPARGAGAGSRASSSGKGRAGEEAAARLLEAEGYRLLARNFRGPAGELDIVALRGDTIAFVEVKSWSALGPEALADSIGARKRRRIVETSKIFLVRNRQYSSMRARYDVLLMRDGIVARRIESAFTGDL